MANVSELAEKHALENMSDWEKAICPRPTNPVSGEVFGKPRYSESPAFAKMKTAFTSGHAAGWERGIEACYEILKNAKGNDKREMTLIKMLSLKESQNAKSN